MSRTISYLYRHADATLLVVTVLVLIVTVVVLGNQESRRFTPVSRTTIGPAELSGTREEQAIVRAEAYLKDSITTLKTPERLFLDYLQRKFGLNKTLGVGGPPIDLYEDPRTYPQETHYLARIAYPDRIVTVSPEGKFDTDSQGSLLMINVYSANCDRFSLPNNFWQMLEKNTQAGGYAMTHVALALRFIDDNNCPVPPVAEKLANDVALGMAALADNPATSADLRYEAIAFLYLSGRRDLVQSRWLAQVVTEQQKDGSWSVEASDDQPDPHATLLALWALLEYARPNTPAEPLIYGREN